MFYGKPNSKRFQQPIVGLRRSLEVLMAHRKSSKPNISLVATVPKVWFGKHSSSLLRAALSSAFFMSPMCRWTGSSATTHSTFVLPRIHSWSSFRSKAKSVIGLSACFLRNSTKKRARFCMKRSNQELRRKPNSIWISRTSNGFLPTKSTRVMSADFPRSFLAGDSAHIHTPAGAQGMNTGIQDGYNLAWKLALVIRGKASERLLQTYNEERLENAKHLFRFCRRHGLVYEFPPS